MGNRGSAQPGPVGDVRRAGQNACRRRHQIEVLFIQPGKPMQNTFCESFNRRLRDECLNAHWFLLLADAQFYIEQWRRRYNTERPHESCYPLTPAESAQTFTVSSPARLSAWERRTDGGPAQPRQLVPDEFFSALPQWGRWKHTIVEKYLRIWAYKLGSRHRTLVFVDGCAGAGIYGDGALGSPVIAARMNDDPSVRARCAVLVIACEESPDNARTLRAALAPFMHPGRELAFVFERPFDEALKVVDDAIRGHPTLLFIDPWGMKDATPANLGAVLERGWKRQELLLRVDDILLARWIGQLRHDGTNARKAKLAESFMRRLTAMGMNPIEMQALAAQYYDRGELRDQALVAYLDPFQQRFRFVQLIPIRASYHARPKYYLLHGTDSPDGAALMNDIVATTEDAIWEVSEDLRAERTGQADLFDVPRPRAVGFANLAQRIVELLEDNDGSREWIEIRAILALEYGSAFRDRDHRQALSSLLRSRRVTQSTASLGRETIIALGSAL